MSKLEDSKTEPSKVLSVVIPCFNEARNIRDCLVSLKDNEIDFDTVEFLLVDGDSTDETVATALSVEGLSVRCVRNQERIKPVGLNIGIREALGEFIMRIDAHCTYAPGYIDKIVAALKAEKADNVGGVQLARAHGDEFFAEAIATTVSHPLGMGNAMHRMDLLSSPTYVDTVFCGCYRRDVFEKVGFFNERLIRTQDREFNQRLLDGGGRILLLPDVHAYYRPRTRLWDHTRWTYNGSFWLSYAAKFTNVKMVRLRNFIPAAFVLYLVALVLSGIVEVSPIVRLISFLPLIVYGGLLGFFAIRQSIARRRLRLALTFPMIVIATHLSYGVGSILGWIKRHV